MIKAIFLSRFHPEKGPIVAHQIPEGAIVPSPNATIARPLFDFPSISSYLIPPQEFCNRLVTICANRCRIIGYPVCIVDLNKYNRNEYIFNIAIVLDESEDFTSFEGVVRKLARLFMELEVGRGLLSEEEKAMERKERAGNLSVYAPHVGGKVYAICEMILEDLNNYCECMTPIDSANTLNMKLFPTYPSPSRVKPFHVPLATTRLSTLASAQTWDLTTTRLLPYINGLNSVSDIARLADADIRLVRRGIMHLLYYGFLLLLDIFTTSAVYAPTPEIGVIFTDEEMQEECIRYTNTNTSLYEDDFESVEDGIGKRKGVLKKDELCRLYAGIRHGLTVRAWCLENAELLHGVDVRRFITFGVIKGFLYRVHKYAVAVASSSEVGESGSGVVTPQQPSVDVVAVAVAATRVSTANGSNVNDADQDRAERDSRLKSGEESGQSSTPTGLTQKTEIPIGGFLDGLHLFDEICTVLEADEKIVMERARKHGEVQLIYR